MTVLEKPGQTISFINDSDLDADVVFKMCMSIQIDPYLHWNCGSFPEGQKTVRKVDDMHYLAYA